MADKSRTVQNHRGPHRVGIFLLCTIPPLPLYDRIRRGGEPGASDGRDRGNLKAPLRALFTSYPELSLASTRLVLPFQ
jgi:hypothetical protein